MSRPPGVGDFEYRGRKDGLMDVQCWCMTTEVAVTPEDVRAGLTGSCGDDWCGPEYVPRRARPKQPGRFLWPPQRKAA